MPKKAISDAFDLITAKDIVAAAVRQSEAVAGLLSLCIPDEVLGIHRADSDLQIGATHVAPVEQAAAVPADTALVAGRSDEPVERVVRRGEPGQVLQQYRVRVEDEGSRLTAALRTLTASTLKYRNQERLNEKMS